MNSTVAIVGVLTSVLIIYIGYVLSKPSTKVKRHIGDKIRSGTMRRAYDTLESPGPHLVRAFLFTAPALVFLSILFLTIIETFVGSMFLIALLWIFLFLIIFNITLNGIAKNINSLGLSNKEMHALREEIKSDLGPGRYFGMKILARLHH
jgi:hypothetical protein